jgi:hypothetical protein
MNTDFKSLERRYGTLLATKIQEEIYCVELKRFNYYRMPAAIKALKNIKNSVEGVEGEGVILPLEAMVTNQVKL